jgi:hypothetical protein
VEMIFLDDNTCDACSCSDRLFILPEKENMGRAIQLSS